MSDFGFGAIVGGIIGLIPSVLSLIATIYTARSSRLTQLEMKKIELFYVQKRDALETLMQRIGEICSEPTNIAVQNAFISAAKRACIFVSANTADSIESVISLVLNYRIDISNGIPIHESTSIRTLNDKIRNEIGECLEGFKQPPHIKCCLHHAKKRNHD